MKQNVSCAQVTHFVSNITFEYELRDTDSVESFKCLLHPTLEYFFLASKSAKLRLPKKKKWEGTPKNVLVW